MSDTYPKSVKLTDELVRRLPFTTKGQAKIRDDECKGLLLVIGMETKTFSAKLERVVSGIREFAYESFGSFDPEAPDHVGVKDARKAAGKWIADYKNGAKVAAKRGATTLKEAWVRYKARLEAKGRSPSTIDWYAEYIENGPLKNWANTQLVSITPEKAAALHVRITKEHGPYRANGAMRMLRAVYNHAKRKVDRALLQIDVTMLVNGDLHVDEHHTVEDSAIALGQAIAQALGDKKGITRYGSTYAPMDEALARVALDISGRPILVWKATFSQPRIGTVDTEMFEHWFQSVSQAAGITLHIECLYGTNNHHIIEGIYKGFARAMAQAIAIDPRKADAIPSTKGMLGG